MPPGIRGKIRKRGESDDVTIALARAVACGRQERLAPLCTLEGMLLKIGQPRDHGFGEPLGLLSDCHRRIEHFLQVLVVIASDASAADGSLVEGQRAQLEGALAYFATAAPRHTADEEESVFPRLKESAGPGADRVREMVARLEGEHDAADRRHRTVDALVRHWLTHGALSVPQRTELQTNLVALQALYRSHIAIEDGELFPAAARLLSTDQMNAIGGEMAARRRGVKKS